MNESPDPLAPTKVMADNCPTDKEISLGGNGNGNQVVPGGESHPDAQPDCAELV